jgi:hypothetical protein
VSVAFGYPAASVLTCLAPVTKVDTPVVTGIEADV